MYVFQDALQSILLILYIFLFSLIHLSYSYPSLYIILCKKIFRKHPIFFSLSAVMSKSQNPSIVRCAWSFNSLSLRPIGGWPSRLLSIRLENLQAEYWSGCPCLTQDL